MNEATYVYCLVSAARKPSLARVPRGLPGAGRPRLLEAGPHAWLVVADVPLSRYNGDAINARLGDLDWVSRAAVAHEAVVEAFVGAGAVLPMKLFTIFANDERAVSHVAADRKRIDRLIRRVAGRIEIGVRVVLDRHAGANPRAASSSVESGAAYLQRKKVLRDDTIRRTGRARAAAAGAYARLQKRAALARRRPASELNRPEGTLLLDAAFLVPRAKAGSFQRAVRREARALAQDGCGVVLNGPWPPYSFVGD